MKTLAALTCLFASAAFAQGLDPWRAIDLDRPGALEALQRDNPAHYAKVTKILTEAPHLPLSSVEDWIRTQYDVTQVLGPVLFRASLPPQGRLSFVLDGASYTKVIRVEVYPVVTPANEPATTR